MEDGWERVIYERLGTTRIFSMSASYCEYLRDNRSANQSMPHLILPADANQRTPSIVNVMDEGGINKVTITSYNSRLPSLTLSNLDGQTKSDLVVGGEASHEFRHESYGLKPAWLMGNENSRRTGLTRCCER